MSDYDDHDWYEDGECPHCGELRECEHDDTEGDRDDTDNDYPVELTGRRALIVTAKALARCGIKPATDAWLNAFAALVSRLDEQRPDPLERRVPGWTVAPPF